VKDLNKENYKLLKTETRETIKDGKISNPNGLAESIL
jgi:hypothetical protein